MTAPMRGIHGGDLRAQLIAHGIVRPASEVTAARVETAKRRASSAKVAEAKPVPAPALVSPLDAWPAFAQAVHERLEAGAVAYGDRSFSREPGELLEEIRAELLDVCGWAFVLSVRLERLKREIAG